MLIQESPNAFWDSEIEKHDAGLRLKFQEKEGGLKKLQQVNQN